MKGPAVRFILILIIGSILLLTAALKQEGVYAQNSTRTTNATGLSDDNGVNSQSRLQSKSVNYYDDSSGYLVFPTTMTSEQQQQQKLPAVVMVHEWWGLNDNIKNMANTLAKEGYVVLAVDLYGEVTTDPGRAMEL